jgi:curved DNA-binding protein CbpA
MKRSLIFVILVIIIFKGKTNGYSLVSITLLFLDIQWENVDAFIIPHSHHSLSFSKRISSLNPSKTASFLQKDSFSIIPSFRQPLSHFKSRGIQPLYMARENAHDKEPHVDVSNPFYPEQTPYQILGCSPSDKLENMKKKYKQLYFQYHPDRAVGLSDEMKEEYAQRFQKISWAYWAVKDPSRRKTYDRYGENAIKTKKSSKGISSSSSSSAGGTQGDETSGEEEGEEGGMSSLFSPFFGGGASDSGGGTADYDSFNSLFGGLFGDPRSNRNGLNQQPNEQMEENEEATSDSNDGPVDLLDLLTGRRRNRVRDIPITHKGMFSAV